MLTRTGKHALTADTQITDYDSFTNFPIIDRKNRAFTESLSGEVSNENTILGA